MRKTNLFYVAAAALSLALAACSQEEMPGGNIITPDMETSYAKVRITMAGGPTGRAFGSESEDFDLGTAEEAAVKSIKLLLFDDNKNLVGSGISTGSFSSSTDRNTSGSPAGSVSDTYENAIVKVTLNPGYSKPTKLIAYINSDDIYYSYESALTAKTDNIGNTTSGFVMTNSGYYEGENFKVAVTIDPDDDLYDSEDEAKESDGIEIYVERLAAKIGVELKDNSLADDKTKADVAIYDVEGEKYDIIFEAKKWAATGTAPTMFSLKQAYGDTGFDWAKGSNRSYWAKGVLYENKYETYLADRRPLRYLSANQVISEKGVGHEFGKNEHDYVTEHTFGDNAKDGDEFKAEITATNAIVVGQYKVTGNQADEKFKENKYYDFYLASNGYDVDGRNRYIIYSKKDLIKKLYDLNKIQVTDEQFGEEEITKEKIYEYFGLKKTADNQYKLTIIYEKELYEVVGEDELTDDDFKAVSNAKHYYMGWAYFFAPVKHNYTGDKNVGSYGVVRNHSYNLTVNSIFGLGAPLDEGMIGEDPEHSDPDPVDPDDPTDPDEPGDNPIVPEPDDIRDAYLDATLKVLSWHNLSQEVEL